MHFVDNYRQNSKRFSVLLQLTISYKMKIGLAFISVAFCLTALVSAHPSIDARGFGEEDIVKCLTGITKCLEDASKKYFKSNLDDTVRAVKQAGSSDVCRAVNKGSECMKKMMKKSECNQLTATDRAFYSKTTQFMDFICKEKLNDIGRNWNCLVDPEFINGFNSCVANGRILLKGDCDYDAVMDCAEDAVDSSSQCRADARSLARDLARRGLRMAPDCNDGSTHVRGRRWQNDVTRCLTGLTECMKDAKAKYIKSSQNDTLKAIKNAGLRDVCRDLDRAKDCTSRIMGRSECNRLPASDRTGYAKALQFLNYLCKEKFDDIRRDLDCLLEPNVVTGFQSCVAKGRTGMFGGCDTTTAMNCAEKAVESNFRCFSRARSLARDVVRNAIGIVPGC